ALDDLGLIKRIHWPRQPDVPPQRAAYAHFLDTEASAFDYVLICDIDEFIVPAAGDIRDLVAEAESANPNVAAIAIPWLMFGSSGHEKHESGWVIERFTKCDDELDPSVKTIFRPSMVHNMRTHICDLLTGEYLDNDFKPAEWQATPIYLASPSSGKVLIHHYFTKSRDEWTRRRLMGRADRASIEHRSLAIFDRYHDQPTSNTGALRFALRAKVIAKEMVQAINGRAKTFKSYDASMLVIDGAWLLVQMNGVSPGTKIRVVINDAVEIFTPLSSRLADGRYGFSLNHKWLAENIDTVTVAPVGASEAITLGKAERPSRKQMVKNILRFTPSAEEMLFRRLSALMSQKEGFVFASGLDLPSFKKFPHYEKALAMLTSGTDIKQAQLDDFAQEYGKEGMQSIERFREPTHYCSRLFPA
ncbi:MAG: hypothetical protein EON58_15690, partial [Alphaproteobacteria bacterium]